MRSTCHLIEAIHTDRLVDIDDPEAKRVCRAIGERVGTEVVSAVATLAAAGITATSTGDPSVPQQRHTATLDVADTNEAMAATEALMASGYRPWGPIDGPGRPIQERFRSELTLAKTTDLTMALTLRWPPSGLARLVPTGLVPNANDFGVVALPVAAWPLYFPVRAVRLIVERLGLRPRSQGTLGPFLSTPDSLVRPLLDLARIRPDDVVVDLGCGDGRIIMAAAEHYGCEAVGIESDVCLVAEAKRKLENHPHQDRISLILDDAVSAVASEKPGAHRPARPTTGTVYFVFVPADSASRLVHRLLATAVAGTIIIAHEQHRLPDLPDGAESTPLLTDQGVTVAHRWQVD